MDIEIPNSKLKLKDIPKTFEWDKWEDFALSFNGYKFAGDVCLSYPKEVESYFEQHAQLPGHLTISELRTCLFFVQRRFRHNGYLPETKYIETLYDAMREKVRTKPSALAKINTSHLASTTNVRRSLTSSTATWKRSRPKVWLTCSTHVRPFLNSSSTTL